MQLLVLPSRHWEEPAIPEVGHVEGVVEGHVYPVPEEETMTSSEVLQYWLDRKREEMDQAKDTGALIDVRFEMAFHSAERTEIRYTAIAPSLGKRVRVKQSVELVEELNG